jgi:hypothetical protein
MNVQGVLPQVVELLAYNGQETERLCTPKITKTFKKLLKR